MISSPWGKARILAAAIFVALALLCDTALAQYVLATTRGTCYGGAYMDHAGRDWADGTTRYAGHGGWDCLIPWNVDQVSYNDVAIYAPVEGIVSRDIFNDCKDDCNRATSDTAGDAMSIGRVCCLTSSIM